MTRSRYLYFTDGLEKDSNLLFIPNVIMHIMAKGQNHSYERSGMAGRHMNVRMVCVWKLEAS